MSYSYGSPLATTESESDDEEEEEEQKEGLLKSIFRLQDRHLVQEKENTPCWMRYKRTLTISVLLLMAILGVILMCVYENMEILTAFYVITQIITTIGYGDLTMDTEVCRLFMTIYVLIIIVFIASIINDFGDAMVDKQQDRLRGHMIHVADRKMKRLKGPVPQPWGQRLHLFELAAAWAIFLLFVAFGTIFYALYEKCSCSYGETAAKYPNCTPETACETGATKGWVDTFYMSIITLTTVGFGDFTPVTKLGRGIGIIWMFFGVLASANMVGAVTQTLEALQTKVRSEGQITSDLVNEIHGKDNTGHLGGLDESQFIEYMLIKNGYVKKKDIKAIEAIFNNADLSNDGRITLQEIKETLAIDEAQ